MSLKGKITSVALTDTGKVREHNEDMIGSEADIGLFVLADGLGGFNAGEVASGIVVKTIINLVRDAFVREDLTVRDAESGLTRPSIILRDAIQRANKIIYHTSKTQPQCEGMGTTVVACLFHDNKVSIAHVGDSRAYRLRDNRFEQMTLDHSLLQERVDRGCYSEQEAQRATNKNYVTRALGVEQNVDVEIHEQPAQKSDYYVLCSDGLSDMIEDEDIHLTISTFSANLDTVAKQLIQLSNDNGGRGKVSGIMAHVAEPVPPHPRIFFKKFGWVGLGYGVCVGRPMLCLGGLVLAEYNMNKERYTIGRLPDNDIRIDNPAVSGHHSLIINILNDSFLEDLNSTNGTYVNGKLIKKHAMQHGDVITVGHHQLRFVDSQDGDTEQDEFEKTMVITPSTQGEERIRRVGVAVDQAAKAVAANKRPGVPDNATALPKAKLQVLSGAFAGRELELTKALTTLGRPGVQVAAITRRAEGYFIVHVDSGKENDFPQVNGVPIGPQARRLNDNDVVQLAGVKMGFFES